MTCKKTKKTKASKHLKKEAAAKKKRGRKSQTVSIEQAESQNEQTSSMEQFNNSVDTTFFYTSDKKLNAMDDDEIVMKIIEQYPEFSQSNKDTQLRKQFLTILDDKILIDDILEYYNLTIHEFFKIIYKQYSSLFNTLFIKKVRQKLEDNGYPMQ